jgi:hypothetical protein
MIRVKDDATAQLSDQLMALTTRSQEIERVQRQIATILQVATATDFSMISLMLYSTK